MKLASLKSGERDGRLVVVDRTLSRCVPVPRIAATLQAALDRWSEVEAALEEVAAALEDGGRADALPFAVQACTAPLPRAYQWADGSTFLNHIELVRKARGTGLPPSLHEEPLIYQGGSDDLLGPCDDGVFIDEGHGIDLEAEVAVITDDVPLGTPAAAAAAHVKLILLVNDWSLRNLVPAEVAKGFGFYQAKPATAFSAVAVTPRELGDAWRDGRVHGTVQSHVNGVLLGRPDAGVDMSFGFHGLIAHAARTRRLGAGTIIGSGTVSNRDRSRGSSCLIERRTIEQLDEGAPRTPFLKFGDRIRIEMLDADGRSIFGAIEERVVRG